MNTFTLRTGFAVAICSIAMMAAGCKDNATQTGSVSDADVANTVAASLGSPTNGMASQAQSATNIASTGKPGLAGKDGSSIQGTQQDTTINVSGTNTINNDTYTYNYTFTAHSSFILSNDSVSSIFIQGATKNANLTLGLTGTYETPLFTGNDNIAASWAVGNILGLTPYTLGGTYTRNGKITGKAQGNSFSYNNALNLSNVLINRITKKIESGTATVMVTGSLMNSSGQSVADYDFTGLVTFLGNDTAQLDLTNNKTAATASFTIDLTKSSAKRRI